MLWGPKLKLFWHTTCPKSAQLSAPFFFSCGPHIVVFLKGADSRAVLRVWRCENSINFGSAKALCSPHKCPGHCNAPTTWEWITMLWWPKLKLFWHTTGPKSAPLPAPLFLLIWYPHCCVLKGVDSRVVLRVVGCENRFNFGSKSIVIHSQVPGALQCPKPTASVDHNALGAKNLSYFGTAEAPKVLDYPPPFSSHVDPTLLCFERGGQSSSFGGCGVCKSLQFWLQNHCDHTHKCPGHCNAPTTREWITMLWGPQLKLFWHNTGPKSAPLPAPFFFSFGIHIVVF